jgi:hypothetical protein
MSAWAFELALEAVPLVLIGMALRKLLLSAGFHNTKYLRQQEEHL